MELIGKAHIYLSANGHKLVLLDRDVEGLQGVPRVICNNHYGASQITKYLIKLGHKDFYYIGGSANQSTEGERLRGFLSSLEEHVISISKDRIAELGFENQRAYDHVTGILKKGTPRITVIVCGDDIIAYGALNAVRDFGLQVPGDISIVGYDDIPMARHIGLTTVHQPAFEMGRTAMLYLNDLISGTTPPSINILDPSVVIRSSCDLVRTVQQR